MPSNALQSQGMEIRIGSSGSPVTYTKISEVVSIQGPGGNAQVIDITNLSSAAIEKTMGLPDEGQVTLDLNYVPSDTQQAALRTARANQTKTPFRIAFPDGDDTVWDFFAYVLGFSVSAAVNSAVKASITLEVTGAVEEGTDS